MTDQEKREQLIKSYEGQITYLHKRIERDKRRIATNRRVKRDPADDIIHSEWLIEKWQERIDMCRNGVPLEEFVGKSLPRKGEPKVRRIKPKKPNKKKKKKVNLKANETKELS